MTLAAGAYGYTTKRDLSGMGGILFVGLIGVIVASVVGIFVQLPLLYIGISAVAAVLFTGFLVFDLNRVASSRGATEGQAILLAVSVYLDIVNLFLALLRLFGIAGGGSRRQRLIAARASSPSAAIARGVDLPLGPAAGLGQPDRGVDAHQRVVRRQAELALGRGGPGHGMN